MEYNIQLSENRLRRQSELLHRAVESSMQLLTWLNSEGFQPLSVNIEPERRPVIMIALQPKCEWLKTGFRAYSFTRTATLSVWRCQIMGCKVQWVEKGN